MAREGALILQRQMERKMNNTSNQNSECQFPAKFDAAHEVRELSRVLPSRSSGTWAEGFADGVLFVLRRWKEGDGRKQLAND